MSNIGLGNLTELKAFCLAESIRQGQDFDAALTSIGKGVAAVFNRYCDRVFERGEDITETVGANRSFYYVKRAPIESVSTIEVLTSDTDGWQTQTGVPENTINETGRIYFGYEFGTWYEQIRVTYTGGYWFDTSEDGSESLPSGATQLPEDIKLAWLLQCQHVFNQRDTLGVSPGQEPSQAAPLVTMELVPEVRRILQQRIRYSI